MNIPTGEYLVRVAAIAKTAVTFQVLEGPHDGRCLNLKVPRKAIGAAGMCFMAQIIRTAGHYAVKQMQMLDYAPAALDTFTAYD